MLKLLFLFYRPADPTHFSRFYHEGFAPLARTLPGLQTLVSSEVKGDLLAVHNRYYLTCELYFANREDFATALRSDTYQQLGRVLSGLAGDEVTVLVTESGASDKQPSLTRFEELTL